MLNWAANFFTKPHAALIAALFAAIGVEAPNEIVTHVFEIMAALIAIIGFFLRQMPKVN